MKTIRLFGVALLTVLMSVSFSACGDSDDDDNGGGSSSASIEGIWYLKSEIWYDWNDTANKPESTPRSIDNYGDYAKELIWALAKNGDNFDCKGIEEDGYSYLELFYHDSGNEYYTVHERYGYKIDRIIFKSVSEKQMVVEIYDSYYDHPEEFGILTFMR